MLPYMQQQDVNALDTLFEQYRPKTVLEWGCGGSTVYFPKRHNCIEWWYSIEHDSEWIMRIQHNLAQNTTVHCFSNDYVKNFVTKRTSTFADFIIVDGVQRKECLAFAFNKCKDDALVFLHDTGRIDYHAWFDIFPHYKQLTEGRVPDREKGGYKRDGLTVLTKRETLLHAKNK